MPLNKNAYLCYRIIDQCLTNSMRPLPEKVHILGKISEALGPVSFSSIEKDFSKMKEIFGSPIVFDRAIKGYTYDEMDFPASNFRSPANTIKFNDVKKSREYIKSKKDEKDESEDDE